MHRVRVRDISDVEGTRLLRIVLRGSGSGVTWRRAQVVLPSAQGMAGAPATLARTTPWIVSSHAAAIV